MLASSCRAFGGIGGGADPVTIGRQIALQERAQALIVINHQQMRIGQGRAHGCHAGNRCQNPLAGLAVFVSAMLQYVKPGPGRGARPPKIPL